MEFTKEEKEIFSTMQALYESGLPISFKGSMVLKAFLAETGYKDRIRSTADFDGNWFSEKSPSAETITESVQKALSSKNIDLSVSVFRMYGEKKSLGLNFIEKKFNSVAFTMDMDVNRGVPNTKMYEIDGFKFRGVTPNQMITDKVAVVSSDKVFRRVKDLIDLYYISCVFDFDYDKIKYLAEKTDRIIGNFDGFINRQEDLEHAYNKFKFDEGIRKAPFAEVHQAVYEYLLPVIKEHSISISEEKKTLNKKIEEKTEKLNSTINCSGKQTVQER